MKKKDAAGSDVTLMVWLTGAPYLIMKELGSRSQSPTEIAKALGRPISWVSKRTGRMERLGLIIKEGPDDHGIKVMKLTDKGRRVMTAITGIQENSLFVELERALDIKAPGDEARTRVKIIAERVKKTMTSGKGRPGIGGLFDAALNASSMKVGGWYAFEDLTYLFSTLDSERWDEPSRLLLVRIIGMAIVDSRNDREYATTYNGLLDPLTRLAMKMDAEVNVRVESIMTIGSLRDYGGKVSDSAFVSMTQVQWGILIPDRDECDLIEGAISEVLRKWAPLLSESQKEVLFRSVGLVPCGRISTSDDPMKDGNSNTPRKVDEKKLNRYRSLVASLLDRDVPMMHA